MVTWMTVGEAAEYLRCGERILRTLMAENQVPHTIFAGKALFNPERLDAWLISMEKGGTLMNKTEKEGSERTEAKEENVVAVLPDCSRDEISRLTKEFKQNEDSFISRLGRNLEKDLEASGYTYLSPKVFAQLSRWCWPKRQSAREQWAQPRAQELSRLIFGVVIERVRHPSYD